MKPRFLADADLNQHIVLATCRLEATVDFQTSTDARLAGLPDSEVLAVAARLHRVLVTHDAKTMPREFATFVARAESPGVLILPQHLPVAEAAEELFLIWLTTTAEEWAQRIVWLPL